MAEGTVSGVTSQDGRKPKLGRLGMNAEDLRYAALMLRTYHEKAHGCNVGLEPWDPCKRPAPRVLIIARRLLKEAAKHVV